MKTKIIILFLLGIFSFLPSEAQQIVVHDPVMVQADGTYYLFCTGMGISSFSSADMKNWKKEKPVFAKAPEWAVNTVPGFKGHIWAPDIIYFNGKYNLFYSVSAFGKNTSCIGLVTTPTLKQDDPAFKWTDHGKIIQSVPGRDDWNAIDPNLIVDENNQPWLAFGSFWSGIKLVKLRSDLTAIAEPQEWYGLAKRPKSFSISDTLAGDGAIEAPFIFRHKKYYYLFVSFDYCCRGVNSNYKIMVGRSEKVTGPYLDKDGKAMAEGGGSLVLQGDENYHGLGHSATYTFNGKDYIIYHAYDSKDAGKPKLIISELAWSTDDWPQVVRQEESGK